MRINEEISRFKKLMGIIQEGDDQEWDGVLVGGLDTRRGDYPLNTQVSMLKKGLGEGKNIKGFRYNAPTSDILQFLNYNPNIPVYLFSAGCSKSAAISSSPNVDKNKLYIIEPFAKSANVRNVVQAAIQNGVPTTNVFYGTGSARGQGIVENGTKTPSNNHWDALEFAASQSLGSVGSEGENEKPVNVTAKIGDRGGNVSRIQKILKIYSDGIFGEQTKQCVQNFQKQNNLEPTGIIDVDTLDKIKLLEKGIIDYESPSFCKVKGGRDSGSQTTSTENIIIGDSQTPFVDMNTIKASRIAQNPGKSSLWEGGKSLSWLIDAVNTFKESPNVKNVIIVIGTNGGFNPKDNVSGLFSSLKTKFPNAKFYAVQGSWGWGGNKNITIDKVRSYYDKFKSEGATIIEPPIGAIEPHGNKPVYKQIGAAIDSLL